MEKYDLPKPGRTLEWVEVSRRRVSKYKICEHVYVGRVGVKVTSRTTLSWTGRYVTGLAFSTVRE